MCARKIHRVTFSLCLHERAHGKEQAGDAGARGGRRVEGGGVTFKTCNIGKVQEKNNPIFI